MILSFHGHVKGDINLRLKIKGLFTEQEAKTIASAQAVIVPQSIKPQQYESCLTLCRHIFPNYACRFGFEGKYANIQLFRKFDVSHPVTTCYESVEEFSARHFMRHEPLLPFPFVLKGNEGGGGWAVFLVTNQRELTERLQVLANTNRHPTKRFIAQAFVPHGGRDLRVVVIGKHVKAYWRCQCDPEEFRNNVGRGALVVHHLDPELKSKGIRCVTDFCSKTGINLAAFDVLFNRSEEDPEPLLSEINFIFGRKGIGGSERFHRLLNQAVQAWIQDIGMAG